MKKYLILLFVFVLLLIYYMLPNKVAVLGYHSFSNIVSDNEMVISKDKFEKQLKFLKRHHFKSLSLNDMECYMNNKCKIQKNTVLITLDDGYLDNYNIALPLIKKYGFNAVIFVIGYNVNNNVDGYINKDIIEKIKKEYPNIEIASHGYNLHEINTTNYSYRDYISDIKTQKTIINSNYYAYPKGIYNKNYMQALKDNNYKLAFGFGPVYKKASNKDDKYAIPRLSINGSMPLWKFKLRLLLPY